MMHPKSSFLLVFGRSYTTPTPGRYKKDWHRKSIGGKRAPPDMNKKMRFRFRFIRAREDEDPPPISLSIKNQPEKGSMSMDKG